MTSVASSPARTVPRLACDRRDLRAADQIRQDRGHRRSGALRPAGSPTSDLSGVHPELISDVTELQSTRSIGSLWCSGIGVRDKTLVRLERGPNPPPTCNAEVYVPPSRATPGRSWQGIHERAVCAVGAGLRHRCRYHPVERRYVSSDAVGLIDADSRRSTERRGNSATHRTMELRSRQIPLCAQRQPAARRGSQPRVTMVAAQPR